MSDNTLQKPIKTAVIVSKVYKRNVSGALREIAGKLESLGVKVFLDANTSVGFNIPEIESVSIRQMRDLDLIIVVGGDGSVLGAARNLVDLKVPVLGVNRGHLGLLTDVTPETLDKSLEKIVQGRYKLIQKMVLSVSHLQ